MTFSLYAESSKPIHSSLPYSGTPVWELTVMHSRLASVARSASRPVDFGSITASKDASASILALDLPVPESSVICTQVKFSPRVYYLNFSEK